MSQKKTPWTPITEDIREGVVHQYRNPKTYLCDMANANACQKRAAWYGTETIGPRLYALYKCATHGMFKRRINGEGRGSL